MNNYPHSLLTQVAKPGRYTGGEVNSVKKDLLKVSMKVALAFPDTYEIAISNLGMQILYSILNDKPHIAAERVYAPWDDMEALLREKKLPLCSLESHLPLSEFDMIGFSLQHELGYTNLLNMLDLGRIPLFSTERENSAPLIIAGGPSAFNPEPLAHIVDVFFLGDGEEGILEICDAFIEWEKSGKEREGLLEALSKIEGVYIPAFFDVEFSTEGEIIEIVPKQKRYKSAKRRILKSLEEAPYPTRFIVPNIRPVHERIPIEVARGCSRFCHFCQAGYVYLPVRERTPEFIDSMGERALKETGFNEVALLSLSTGDYSCIDGLLPGLTARYKANNIDLSFPSLRIDTITPTIMEEMKKMRAKSFTIAPEAGSQRLRDLINKGITEEAILDTVVEMSKAGSQALKLYFMIGLPTETEEDLDEIMRLSRLILKKGRAAGKLKGITVNLSTFVPKAHTPFQWARQLSLEEVVEKHNYLKKNLKERAISLKWQAPFMSLLEGVFSRGDRRLGDLLVDAFKRGCRFDGWGDKINKTAWEEAFKEANIDVNSLLGEKSPEGVLPWECIDTGVDKAFLLKELERSGLGQPTEDCRYEACSVCGVCDHKEIKIRTFGGHPISHRQARRSPETPLRTRLRVHYSKQGLAALLGHIDSMQGILAMMRRASIPLAYSEGFHPHPKVSFSSPVPLGTESLSEFFDAEVKGVLSPEEFLEAIKLRLPSGIEIIGVKQVTKDFPSITSSVEEETYRVTLPDVVLSGNLLREMIEKFHTESTWPATKTTKKGPREIDLKELVNHLSLASDRVIEIKLSAVEGKSMKAKDAVSYIFHLTNETKESLAVLKTETLFKQVAKQRKRTNL